tara:strand:+ start:437 stop:1093 length:657 start_codon:yes stop_codon:yes gene_type:complete
MTTATNPPAEWHLMGLVPARLRQDAQIAVEWLWNHQSTPEHFKTQQTFVGVVKKWVKITTSIKTWKFVATFVTKASTSHVVASINWTYRTFTSPTYQIPKPKKKISFDQLRKVNSVNYGTQSKSNRSEFLYGPTPGPAVNEKERKREGPGNSEKEYAVEGFPTIPPFSSDQLRESTGHSVDCVCGRCHFEDYQTGEIDCRGPDFCVSCRMGRKLAPTG